MEPWAKLGAALGFPTSWSYMALLLLARLPAAPGPFQQSPAQPPELQPQPGWLVPHLPPLLLLLL